MSSKHTIGVGIIGLGRSGWGIHCKAIPLMPEKYKVVAVTDPIAERVEEAKAQFGCAGHADIDALLADPNVEMCVVAPPNALHAPYALKALEAGKHVLCEKPFGLDTDDVDRMIAASEKAGVVLQPFQQRRYEPDFLKVKEVCESGRIGEVHFARICWHGFKRRWDWQTLTSMAGGALNNNGPHPIDHAMELFGDADPDVWCEMRRVLCSGDAEDHLKIILTGEGRPTIEIELFDATVYGQDRWLVCGNAGGLRGNADGLEWKWVDWSTMPERPVSDKPTPDRSYNSEKLTWHTDTWQPAGAADAGAGAAPAQQPVIDMYSSLYATIREGKPQAITPQSVRRRVLVMEKCRASAGVELAVARA